MTALTPISSYNFTAHAEKRRPFFCVSGENSGTDDVRFIEANNVIHRVTVTPFNSTHHIMLYPQNGDRIVTIDSVTSLHPMQGMRNVGDVRTFLGDFSLLAADTSRVLVTLSP